jgi:hypothetical protein
VEILGNVNDFLRRFGIGTVEYKEIVTFHHIPRFVGGSLCSRWRNQQ